MEKEKEKDVQPEEIITSMGGCGRFQIILSFVMHLLKLSVVFNMYVVIFSNITPDWWCDDDVIDDVNMTSSDRYVAEAPGFKSCVNGNNSKCRRLVYDQEYKTIVNEWDMACDDSWIPPLIGSLQMAGLLLGNLVCGHMADRLGRKLPMYMALLIMLLSDIAGYFCNSWQVYAAARTICGIGMGCFLTVQYTVATEFTFARWRSYIVAAPSWAIEACIFSLCGYLVPNWRTLHLISAILILPMLGTWWFIPESFRWLLSHGRDEEALTIVKKVTEFNNKTFVLKVDDLSVVKLPEDSGKKIDRHYTLLDLFKSRSLIKSTLLSSVNWFTLGIVSYGIQFGIQEFSGNFFLNMFLLSIISIPVMAPVVYGSNNFGRRATSIFSYLLCMVGATVVAIMNHVDVSNRRDIMTGFAYVAVTAISMAWSPVQQITLEQTPTVVRNITYGLMNMCGRVGAIVGPQLAYLDTRTAGVMYIISAVFCFVSSFGTLFLKETRDKDLPDLLDDGKKPEGKKSIEEIKKEIKRIDLESSRL